MVSLQARGSQSADRHFQPRRQPPYIWVAVTGDPEPGTYRRRRRVAPEYTFRSICRVWRQEFASGFSRPSWGSLGHPGFPYHRALSGQARLSLCVVISSSVADCRLRNRRRFSSFAVGNLWEDLRLQDRFPRWAQSVKRRGHPRRLLTPPDRRFRTTGQTAPASFVSCIVSFVIQVGAYGHLQGFHPPSILALGPSVTRGFCHVRAESARNYPPMSGSALHHDRLIGYYGRC